MFEPVLAALDGAGVRFVVVGGVAVVLHGHPRMTADLDLVIDLAAASASSAIQALLDLGLEVDLFVQPPLPLDELWERATVVQLEGQQVRIASVDDLIAMKRQVGRPQDLADIAALEALRG